MFAVVNHLQLSVPPEQIADEAEKTGVAVLSGLPGFEGIELVKAGENHLIVILFWDSPANAENGAKTFGPTWFAQNIAPYLAAEQQRSAGPVLTHFRR